MALRDVIASILGISAYQRPKGFGLELDDAAVETIRKALGGNLQPIVTTKLRWYIADLERAQGLADQGNLETASQLVRAMRRDGVQSGLMGTRTSGLVRLPKRFHGDNEIAATLNRNNGTRSVFDEMFPPAELAALDADGITLGVGVGEMMPVAGRSYPVLVRLDPEFLQYRWNENRWYFLSNAGALPITPGDGRWVLHLPGARMSPWNNGLWPALGRSFINKEHAMLHRSNYSGKLANAARAAIAPSGATEAQRIGFFKRLLAWATNTVLELPPGWDVKLIESNGKGIEVFQKEIDTCDLEFMVAIAGQIVTTSGGVGFSNSDIHRRIREDLIKSDGEALAYTINTQGLPAYIASTFGGVGALSSRWVSVEWDTSTPKELEAEARTMLALASAIAQLSEVLDKTDRTLDVDELAVRFGVPLIDPPANTVALEPSEAASQPSIAKATARLVKFLPPAARKMSVDELAALARRAA